VSCSGGEVTSFHSVLGASASGYQLPFLSFGLLASAASSATLRAQPVASPCRTLRRRYGKRRVRPCGDRVRMLPSPASLCITQKSCRQQKAIVRIPSRDYSWELQPQHSAPRPQCGRGGRGWGQI